MKFESLRVFSTSILYGYGISGTDSTLKRGFMNILRAHTHSIAYYSIIPIGIHTGTVRLGNGCVRDDSFW